MKAFARTDIGKIRPINEDSFYLPAPGERFCAVADGMGGHNAGEIASAMAIQVFAECMRKSGLSAEAAMKSAVEQANLAIYTAAQKTPAQRGMGTTFTAFCEEGGVAHIAHVGDSRAYLIRNGAIVRVTTDHTLVEEMVLKGMITLQEARVHPRRNYITRSLGTADHVEVDLLSIELCRGDLFLLCSDGLSGAVEERELLKCAICSKDYAQRLEDMVSIALKRGGHDNITAILIACEEVCE